MNKFILATALLFPALTLATTEAIPSQAAIDPRGACKVFTTAYDIPDTWKQVDSCENYAPAKTGASPEEVLKRRWQQRLAARPANTKKVKKETVLNRSRSRIGSGKLTRGGADRVTSLGEKRQPRRTSTTKQYGTSKKFLLNDSRRQKKSRSEWVRRRSARAGIKSGTATSMKRTGELSGKFWSTESAQRNQRLKAQETTTGWKNYLSNRQQVSSTYKRREKKKYVYKGIGLRRLYRGTRLEGDIESYTNRKD